MKTNRAEIIDTALILFAQRGFKAVSTGDIAAQLGITKGALYRHFDSKQAIFDAILQHMTELDAERAAASSVPEKLYSEDAESYGKTTLHDICAFLVGQFDFWTEDEFARNFRRLLILEQYSSARMMQLYQDTLARGPVSYTEDVLRELAAAGRLSTEAASADPRTIAVELFAPLSLALQLYDGGYNRLKLREQLAQITENFEERYTCRGKSEQE